VVACSPYAIVVHSGGIIRYVNEAMVALVGAESQGELVGRAVLDLYPPDMREVALDRIVRLISGDAQRARIIEERIVRLDGREIDVEMAAAATTFDDSPAILVFLHDITERREAARVIRCREQILNAVAFAADHFLRDASWRESIDEVLRRLGEAVGVSRVYIFENHAGGDGELHASQRFEWTAPGVDPQIDSPELQDIPWRAAGFARWVESLDRGEPICGHVREFPESERNILEPQGILSIVVVPIFAGDRWWGLIGFDECVEERRWSAPERDALRLAADIFGAAIGREVADRERQELLEWQRGTLDALPDLLFEIDREGRLYYCHAADPRKFYVPPEVFLGRRVEEVLPDEAATVIMEAVQRAGRTGRDSGTAYSLELDGEVRWFELSIARKGLREGQGERLIALARDITERKRAESVKDEFISTVSHELRTPLSAIHASVDLLRRALDGGSPSEQAARLVDIARRNSDRLVRLIDDLLDVQKIEAGKMTLRLEPLDLAGLVQRAVEDNQPYADNFGVRLILPGEIPDARVRGDEIRLLQVMTNLLSNAAKYSPRDGVVEVGLERGAGVVRVSVRDHGPGIPEAFRDRIFERFCRADSSLSRERGGTGLGLNIARSIVEMHGGQIGFDTRPGEGTTFFFELPVSDASETP
jgi:PAS domain S-box-containing protein